MKGPLTIVFDLGGVLVDWNPRYLYRGFFDDHVEMEFFLQNVCHSEWNEKQDEGRSLALGTEVKLKEFPEHREPIEMYYDRWPEMLNGPIHETVEILEELKSNRKHRLLALTNWSAETFPIALKRFDFLSWFEGILVSGTEKLIKPDPRIYKLLVSRYELDPVECIFIDDNLANVNGARQCGMRAIHFTNPNELREQLIEFGVF